MEVMEGGGGIWIMESSGWLFLDQGDWILTEAEGFGKVGDVEVVRMAMEIWLLGLHG